MKAASLIAAGSIIIIANSFALIHAMCNRAGSPESEVTLTQRELQYAWRSPSDEDSGVPLNLRWTGPERFNWTGQATHYASWLDEQKLRKLGFDCSVNPASAEAGRFYERQRPRQVFVALENDGPARRAWLEAWQRGTGFNNLTADGELQSHLVAIDADRDAGQLRARNPDRTKVVILPAVVGITLDNYPYFGRKSDPARPATIQGRVQEVPSSIHVPRPFSDEFRGRAQRTGGVPGIPVNDLFYQVHLRYGRSFEPIVTGVDFTK